MTPALRPAPPPELGPRGANLSQGGRRGRKTGRAKPTAETQVRSHLRYRRHLPAGPTIYPPSPRRSLPLRPPILPPPRPGPLPAAHDAPYLRPSRVTTGREGGGAGRGESLTGKPLRCILGRLPLGPPRSLLGVVVSVLGNWWVSRVRGRLVA